MECHTIRAGQRQRKKAYKSKRACRLAMKRACQAYGWNPSQFNIYRCQECGEYHFGRKREYQPMGRQITDYHSLPLEQIATEYIEGSSARALAEKYGARDHKTLIRYLMPIVEARGQTMRNHTQSQRKRRAMETLTQRDVANWFDPALGGLKRRRRS